MHNTPSSPNGKPNGKPEPPDENGIRWFLVKSIVVLMFVDMGIYAISKEVDVLICCTLLETAVTAIFAFYFTRK